MALLKDGKIEQIGTPEELYHEPASAFVFDFLGDSIQFPCTVRDGKAIIAGCEVNILGRETTSDGPATAYVRPDGFAVGPADGPGFGARIRDVLLAGPDARIDCVLDDDGAIEVRVTHEIAARLAPRNRISLIPREVRVWREA